MAQKGQLELWLVGWVDGIEEWELEGGRCRGWLSRKCYKIFLQKYEAIMTCMHYDINFVISNIVQEADCVQSYACSHLGPSNSG